jgi:hypothetical protein
MIVPCPKCGRRLQVVPDRPVLCPGCQHTFVAPAGADSPAASDIPAAAPVQPAYTVPARTPAAACRGMECAGTIAKPLIVLGLVLVILSRGCDTLSSRGVTSSHAKVTQAQNDFQSKWDSQERKLERERQDVNQRMNDPKTTDQDREGLRKQMTDITDRAKKVRDDKDKEETDLRTGAWASLISTARGAGATHDVWSFWFACAFLLGTLLLVLGLLSMAFTATGTIERILSLGMIAIIVFSIYVGGVAWFTSVASDIKAVAANVPASLR